MKLCCLRCIPKFIIQAEKFWRCHWLRASLFPHNSGITAKDRWYNKVTVTTQAQLRFIFKNMAASFLEMSGEEIEKFAKNTKLLRGG